MKQNQIFTFKELINIYNETLELYKMIPDDIKGSNKLTDEVKNYYMSLGNLLLIGKNYYNDNTLSVLDIEDLINSDINRINNSKENKKNR